MRVASASTARRAAGARWLLVAALLAVIMFGIGFGASCWLTANRSHDTNDHTSHNASDDHESALLIQRKIAMADRLLAQHRAKDALPIYESALTDHFPRKADLHYRIGIANELLGQWDKALDAFREIRQTQTDTELADKATLAEARVHLYQDKIAEARTTLSPLLLVAHARSRPLELSAEIDALGALARVASEKKHREFEGDYPWLPLAKFTPKALMPELEREFPIRSESAATHPAPKQLDDHDPNPTKKHETPHAESPKSKPSDDHEKHDSPAKEHESGAKIESPKKGKLSAQEPDETLETKGDQVTRAATSASDVSVWLSKLAAQAHITLETTEKAKSNLAHRGIRLHLTQLSAREIIHRVADHLDLVVLEKGGVVRVLSMGEVDEQEILKFRRTQARHRSEDLAKRYPNHRLTQVVKARLVERYFDERAYDEAAQGLRDLTTLRDAGMVMTAQHNLAMLRASLGDFPEARRELHRLLDRGPAHSLSGVAYFYLGRLALEEGDFPEADLYFRRALSQPVSRTSDSAETNHRLARTILHIASMHLMSGRLVETSKLLDKHRQLLSEKSYRATARFLDAYAVHKSAPKTPYADLLPAIWEETEASTLGTLSAYLRCEALQVFALWAEIARVSKGALKTTNSPLRHPLRYYHADALMKLGRGEDAEPHFLVLVKEHRGLWGAQAQLQLAELSLRSNRIDECLARCDRLYSERILTNNAPLFQIWGQAFQKKNDDANALRCFSGQEPIR